MKKEVLRALTEKYGKRYSDLFHINLRKEPFKWFLLATLFGARISEDIALRTYKMFEIYNVTSPERIIEEGWDSLVAILDSGGYTRYDFKTADKLLELARNLSKENLNEIHRNAKDFEDLVSRLKSLAKGIGDTTVGIFLREMIGIWDKAKPYPTPLARLAAKNLGIGDVEDYWKENLEDLDYAKFESMLAKIGKLCRRGKCSQCPAREICEKGFNKGVK
ncbi:hypothetical protein ABOONEI_363 [Aciduliprofundum boonei T469]|nr:hypothetical protein ABOONEI_363 [Aciduliprofundum boonei T469]